MNAQPCIRCGRFWASNSGARDAFTIVTKWCPDCVAAMPVMGHLAHVPATGMVSR